MSNGKLNQILAVEKGRKSDANSAIDRAYKLIQKSDLFNGLTRTYTPKDDEGDRLPDEKQIVTVTVPGVVDEIREAFTRLIDVTAQKDKTNTEASANVVIDGVAILEDVPVTTLLFLEKQLTDLHTFVSKLPTLDITSEWEFDDASDTFRTDPVKTNRTKKIMRNHVLYDATPEHPAQVETYTEDEIVGTWEATKLSGAIEIKTQREWLDRVNDFRDAVKFARETANETEVIDVKYGDAIFNYIFG